MEANGSIYELKGRALEIAELEEDYIEFVNQLLEKRMGKQSVKFQ